MSHMSLLRRGGTLAFVGFPEQPLVLSAFPLVIRNIKLAGSLIGSPSTIAELLQVAKDKNIKPWIKKYSMKDANQAVVDMHAGKARYRFVLVNEHYGGTM